MKRFKRFNDVEVIVIEKVLAVQRKFVEYDKVVRVKYCKGKFGNGFETIIIPSKMINSNSILTKGYVISIQRFLESPRENQLTSDFQVGTSVC